MIEIKKAVILCGGLGTRFLPLTKSIPKEMIPVYDKPILQVLVEQLADAGVTDCLIVLGRNKETIQNHFDRNIELENVFQKEGKEDYLKLVENTNCGVQMTYVRAREPKGTGDALYYAKNFAGNDPFYVLCGDEITLNKENIFKQLKRNYDGNTILSVKKVKLEDVEKYGIIDISKEQAVKCENGEQLIKCIKGIVEKPKKEEAPSQYANLLNAIVNPDIFDKIDATRNIQNEVYLTYAFDILAKEGKLDCCLVKGNRQDMGTPLEYVKANVIFCLTNDKTKDKMIKFIKDLAKKL